MSPLLEYLLTQQAQQAPTQPAPASPTLANLNLPTGPGQMSPLGTATAMPQAPGQQTPSFEQMQSPAQAGSQVAQAQSQQQAGPLGGLAPAAQAAQGAATGGMSAFMTSAMPYLAALQYLQNATNAQQTTIGGRGGGGFTMGSGGLF